jgi:hypothetical protein
MRYAAAFTGAGVAIVSWAIIGQLSGRKKSSVCAILSENFTFGCTCES